AEVLPGQTYSVTLNYDETAVPPYLNQEALALYYWNGFTWVKEPTSEVDIIAKRITATPNHFSSWAILAQPYIYLPLIME
ncbi:MAG: hypothetical protein KDE51_26635, partial [Anaerolineales bacterium]|nr:hypothetical protein [Anaerolineales bacterium]